MTVSGISLLSVNGDGVVVDVVVVVVVVVVRLVVVVDVVVDVEVVVGFLVVNVTEVVVTGFVGLK